MIKRVLYETMISFFWNFASGHPLSTGSGWPSQMANRTFPCHFVLCSMESGAPESCHMSCMCSIPWHLLLMRFTYLPDEETIIMSSSERTKKYDMLERTGGGWPADRVNGENTKAVAATTTTSGEAVKDEGGGGGEYSITLNGNCNVITDVNLAERYRQIHLRDGDRQ